jgi:uncharacterized repeat protein (TIGR03803 family)
LSKIRPAPGTLPSAPPAEDQTAWKETVLYRFGTNSPDGNFPAAGLIFDAQGELYGTTASAGSVGEGAVFKLTPPAEGKTAWTETLLYSFCSQGQQAVCTDGVSPLGGLIFGAQGALYSTTEQGGSGADGGMGLARMGQFSS